MGRIAICDDELQFQKDLSELVSELPFKMTSTCYADGDTLLADCRKQQTYDLVLMDIQMAGQLKGIDYARELRKLLPDVGLIFVSAYPQYITKVFSSTVPDQFLVKPVRYSDFFDAVTTVLAKQKCRKSQQKFHFKVKGQTTSLSPNEIYYMESFKHDIVVHNEAGKLCFQGTMEEQELRFSQHNFVKIHRSIIVNMGHIRHINKNSVTLDDAEHTILPISRMRYKQVKESYTTYIHCMAGENRGTL